MTNKILLSLIYAGIFIAAGCSDDPWEGIRLQSDSAIEVGKEAQVIRVPLTSSSEWDITALPVRWCQVKQVKGERVDTLVITVSDNIAKEKRQVDIELSNETHGTILNVRQAAAGEDHLFQLPIIFHVLYTDASDTTQNITHSYLMRHLANVNALYRNESGNSVDMMVEFIPAERDPRGQELPEPGVNRIFHPDLPINPNKFQDNEYGDVAGLWNPREYINVFIFPFKESFAAGISTFPYMPWGYPLSGLVEGDRYFSELPDDDVTCIVWNTDYIFYSYRMTPDSPPFEFGGTLTLAHELGHYLGLFHVFTAPSSPDDYCDDTPAYIYEDHVQYLNKLDKLYEAGTIDIFELYKAGMKRTDIHGNEFISTNIMDYEYGSLDRFTPDQRRRVRAVLEYSPLIPGPKIEVPINPARNSVQHRTGRSDSPAPPRRPIGY